MPESSAFTQGQQITHTALNNVRDDVLDPTDGHDHDGTDGRSVLRVTQNAVIERFDLGIDIGGTGGTDVRIDDSSSGSGTTTLYIGNQSITVSSDSRIKQDITPTAIDAMELIRKVRVVDHAWNDPTDGGPNDKNSRGRWTGMIAQEIVGIFPWIVNAENRDCPVCRAGEQCEAHPIPWNVQYEHLAGVFVKALQEMDERFTKIEAKLGLTP